MPDEKLIAYFVECLNKHLSTDEAELALAQQGWPQTDIQDALSVAGLRYEDQKLVSDRQSAAVANKELATVPNRVFRSIAAMIVVGFAVYLIFFVNLPAYDRVEDVPFIAKAVCWSRAHAYQAPPGIQEPIDAYTSSVRCMK